MGAAAAADPVNFLLLYLGMTKNRSSHNFWHHVSVNLYSLLELIFVVSDLMLRHGEQLCDRCSQPKLRLHIDLAIDPYLLFCDFSNFFTLIYIRYQNYIFSYKTLENRWRTLTFQMGLVINVKHAESLQMLHLLLSEAFYSCIHS